MTESHTTAVDSENEAFKLVGNAKAVLSDIDDDDITERERKRLRTIYGKLNEVEDIMAERIAEDMEGEL